MTIELSTGERIRNARERLSLTQAQLAQRAGMSPDSVYRIENGRNKTRPSSVQKLARALDMSPEYLNTGESRVVSTTPGSEIGRRDELLQMKSRLDDLLGRQYLFPQGHPDDLPHGTPPESRPEIQHEQNTGAAVIDNRR